MSQILKNLLQPEILKTLQSFGSSEYTGPTDPTQAQAQLVDQLSTAIARAVQQYLNNSVLTVPLPTLPGGWPIPHPHVNVPHKLTAP